MPNIMDVLTLAVNQCARKTIKKQNKKLSKISHYPVLSIAALIVTVQKEK